MSKNKIAWLKCGITCETGANVLCYVCLLQLEMVGSFCNFVFFLLGTLFGADKRFQNILFVPQVQIPLCVMRTWWRCQRSSVPVAWISVCMTHFCPRHWCSLRMFQRANYLCFCLCMNSSGFFSSSTKKFVQLIILPPSVEFWLLFVRK